MFDGEVIEESSAKPSCIIVDVEEEATLLQLRERIIEEAGDSMPESRFIFVVGQTEVVQEKDTKVIDVTFARNVSDRAICFKKSANVDTPSTSSQSLQDSIVPDTAEEPSTSQTSTSSMLKLKYIDSCTIRGIKVYGPPEIENAEGVKKKRRMFWNKRAKQLAKTTMKKTDIFKQIHQDWREAKAVLLAADARNLGSKVTVKKGTLEKSITRVQQAQTAFNSIKVAIAKLEKVKSLEQKEELKRLREKLSSATSEVRTTKSRLTFLFQQTFSYPDPTHISLNRKLKS
jgi:hypothetical protein